MIKSFSEVHNLPLDVSVDGYLFLVRDVGSWQSFVASLSMQREMGVDARTLTDADVSELMPGLHVDDLVGATYCADDGIADPAGLTLGYLRSASRLGLQILYRSPVVQLLTGRGRVIGIETSKGEQISTATVVNATGPWAAELPATAGVEVPVTPLGRQVTVTGAFSGSPSRRTLVVDAATGFYFHKEGLGVLMGMGAREERPGFGRGVGENYWSDELLPVAVHVLPALADAGLSHTWLGYYEMTPDAHPILGQCPGLRGLWLANGFSGHGFQHAPAVGRLLAELILEGKSASLDVSMLGMERFSSGRLLSEDRVV
jgi:sarcosine oxidase subunit beta